MWLSAAVVLTVVGIGAFALWWVQFRPDIPPSDRVWVVGPKSGPEVIDRRTALARLPFVPVESPVFPLGVDPAPSVTFLEADERGRTIGLIRSYVDAGDSEGKNVVFEIRQQITSSPFPIGGAAPFASGFSDGGTQHIGGTKVGFLIEKRDGMWSISFDWERGVTAVKVSIHHRAPTGGPAREAEDRWLADAWRVLRSMIE